MKKHQPKPPEYLELSYKKLWKTICEQWEFNDAELQVLATGLASLQRRDQARRLIDKEGLTVSSGTGTPHVHPACGVEKAAHQGWLAAFKALHLREDARRKVFEKTENLQPGIEQAFLQLFACQQTGGSAERLKNLDQIYKQKTQEKKAPRDTTNKSVEEAGNQARKFSRPAISWFTQWARPMLQAAPYNRDYAEYVTEAIQQIEAMSLKPLDEILKAIEEHHTKIDNWPFEKKPESMLPALSMRDLVFA